LLSIFKFDTKVKEIRGWDKSHTVSAYLWAQFTDDVRKRAIDFVPSYLQQHPSASDQLYLNQYLKAQPWNN